MKCEWTESIDVDEAGTWETDCHNLFSFTADGPKENDFKFCPYCGRKLVAVEPSPSESRSE